MVVLGAFLIVVAAGSCPRLCCRAGYPRAAPGDTLVTVFEESVSVGVGRIGDFDFRFDQLCDARASPIPPG